MSWPWITLILIMGALLGVSLVLSIGLLRRVTSLLERADIKPAQDPVPPGFGGLLPGERIPPFTVESASGEMVHSSSFLRGPTLLLFMESGCEPCEEFLHLLVDAAPEIDGVPLRLLVDDTPAGRAMSVPAEIPACYQDGSASAAFASVASPQAFAVRGSLVVAKAVPESLDDLTRLARVVAEGGDLAVTRAGIRQ